MFLRTSIVEALGWGRRRFFWVYVAESIPAVIAPMFYPNNFQPILNLMVAFVLVLVGLGVVTGMLASDRRIMRGFVSSAGWKVPHWLSLIATLSFGVVAVAAHI